MTEQIAKKKLHKIDLIKNETHFRLYELNSPKKNSLQFKSFILQEIVQTQKQKNKKYSFQ